MKPKSILFASALFCIFLPYCLPTPAPIYPCFEGDALPTELAEIIEGDLTDCSSTLNEICNSAVSLDEACQQSAERYFGQMPALCDQVSLVAPFDEIIGTCQPPDVHGKPCRENTDCRSDLNLQCIIESGRINGYCEPIGYPELTRLVYIYKRLPELSLNDFFTYWQEVHAPLVVQKAALFGIRGYIQLHASIPLVNTMLQIGRGTLPAYDGVAEIYLDRETFEAALETLEGQQALQELIDDKRHFADLSHSAVWLAKEHVLRKEPRTATGPVVIITWVGSALPGFTPATFQDYYLNNHGAFVVSHAEQMGIKQYIQVHTSLNDPVNETLRDRHGTEAPFYVHAEFIWDFTNLVSLDSASVMALIGQDEQVFIDFSQSALWSAEEKIIIPLEY